MDKFLERHKLLKLTLEESENLNSPKFDFLKNCNEKFSHKENSRPKMAIPVNFRKHLRKR